MGLGGDEMEHWEKVTMARRMYWIRLHSLELIAKKFDISEKEARRWINGLELPNMALTNDIPFEHLKKVAKYRKMPYYLMETYAFPGMPYRQTKHKY